MGEREGLAQHKQIASEDEVGRDEWVKIVCSLSVNLKVCVIFLRISLSSARCV